MLIFTFPFVFLLNYLDKTVIIVKEDFADGWIILNSFLSLHITLNLRIYETNDQGLPDTKPTDRPSYAQTVRGRSFR